jgi:Ferritin-like
MIGLFSLKLERRIMTTNLKTWTKELVQDHAKVAVMVELYTLPFYLTVLTSIKDKKHPDYYSILSICIEEMLHLQLAANLCLALDTQPIFTAPEYGTPIPYLDPKNPTTGHYKLINVKLDALNQTTLDVMLDIETPSGLEDERHPEPGVRAIIRRVEDSLEEKWNMKHHTTPQYPYDSIGDMYDALVTGITKVGENQFSWKTTNQKALWEKEPFKQIIEVPGDVHDAVTTISLQGEGKTTAEGRYAIPPNYRLEDNDDSGSLNEHSHYERLLEIENRKSIDRKFPDVYDVSTATDAASKKKQQDALENLQSRFASLLNDLDRMWNQGMKPDDTNFWSDMCDGLLPAAEECWKAGVVPKWS